MVDNFAPTTSLLSNAQRRNQVYGPRYFDTDLTIAKNFKLPGREGLVLTIGATAYNILNHPNFDQPTADVTDPTFATEILTINPPTSIYGSFLGADASPRLLQGNIKITF